MESPHEGRLTQKYHMPDHAGVDIAPPTPGEAGTPVYAMFAGRLERIVRGRAPGQSASSGRVLARLRSGNGGIVRNPDRERQLFNHVAILDSLSEGDHVTEGQLLGHTDRSGIQTGPHLHLETWTRAGRTMDPLVLFRKYHITPGAAPKHTTGDGGAPSGGTTGPGLSQGDTGQAVKDLQAELNRWKTDLPALRIDGDYGPITTRRVREWQTRNHGGAYPAYARIDGIAGPLTLAGLGLN